MQVYEFQTTFNNGFIEVPLEYKNKIFGKVKVLIMKEDTNLNESNKEEFSFPYFPVDTTGYVFNREEANER